MSETFPCLWRKIFWQFLRVKNCKFFLFKPKSIFNILQQMTLQNFELSIKDINCTWIFICIHILTKNYNFRSVCNNLVSGQTVIAETFPSVSVYFGDIVGFTAMWANSPPLEVTSLIRDPGAKIKKIKIFSRLLSFWMIFTRVLIQ